MNRLFCSGLIGAISLSTPLGYVKSSPDVQFNGKPGVDYQSIVISSVRDFGAKGDGKTDDSAAIQSAINASAKSHPCIFFPHGVYRLATPIRLSGGECLTGENGTNPRGTTVLVPTTAAFVTANPLSQLQSLSICGFLIRGGTNAIDLGLFQQVNLSEITCVDQSGWCLSHVRGERNELRKIFCWHMSVQAKGCLSLADVSHSIFASTYATAHWSDQWWDRSIIDNITDIGNSVSATDQYTIWSDAGALGGVGAFSNSNVRLVLSHRAGQLSPIRMYNTQLSEFHNIATDLVGTPGHPSPVMFDVEGYFLYSALEGFYPKFSGNSHWTTALFFKKLFLGSTVRNCSLGGDNISTFGIRFAQQYASYGEIIACDGAYYNESPNVLWRNQISILGSNLKPVNNSGNINLVDHSDTGASITLMSDGNGALPAKSSFQVIRSTGSGQYRTDFVLSKTGAVVRLPLSAEGGLVEPTASTPATSNAVCAKGAISWDSDFIYVCTAPNNWKRSPLNKF